MDDEKFVRDITGRMLKHVGYEDIEFSSDGAGAVNRCKEAMDSGRPFSVAIIDLTIAGGIGGEMTVKKLLEIDPELKAIVCSGYACSSILAHYKEYGFSGRLAKPYTIEELCNTLSEVIS